MNNLTFEEALEKIKTDSIVIDEDDYEGFELMSEEYNIRRGSNGWYDRVWKFKDRYILINSLEDHEYGGCDFEYAHEVFPVSKKVTSYVSDKKPNVNPKKYLRVTMPDNTRWDVPCEVIAKNRAEYYKEDGYDEEFEYTMSNEFELTDWAANNMYWDDVKKYAKQAPDATVEFDFDDGWCNGEKEFVEY